MAEEKDKDPLPYERTYYRDATTGDLGWMVWRKGIAHIHLDRSQDKIERKYVAEHWTLDREPVPFTLGQVAQIQFAADCKVCYYTGKMLLARRQWQTMPEAERLKFMKDGPDDKSENQERRKVFLAIQVALSKLAR